MGQGVGHVLVNSGMVRVEDIILQRQHVHGETILCHEQVLLSCNKWYFISINL